jgi:hypothetical protein
MDKIEKDHIISVMKISIPQFETELGYHWDRIISLQKSIIDSKNKIKELS